MLRKGRGKDKKKRKKRGSLFPYLVAPSVLGSVGVSYSINSPARQFKDDVLSEVNADILLERKNLIKELTKQGFNQQQIQQDLDIFDQAAKTEINYIQKQKPAELFEALKNSAKSGDQFFTSAKRQIPLKSRVNTPLTKLSKTAVVTPADYLRNVRINRATLLGSAALGGLGTATAINKFINKFRDNND